MTMLSNETVRKLQEMHLGVMAEAFSTQLQDSQFQTVSFEDRFAMLVDAEWSARKSNRLTRLIRNAGYADPAACVEPERPTWPAPLAWLPAAVSIPCGIFACPIYWWRSLWPGPTEPTGIT